MDAKPTAAYELLSERCQEETSPSYSTGIVTPAEMQYGAALPVEDLQAEMSDGSAVVTCTYPTQEEPWVLESGEWKNDQC